MSFWNIPKTVQDDLKLCIGYTSSFLSDYDIKKLDGIKIITRKSKHAVKGKCYFPTSTSGYRIDINIPGPFPHNLSRYCKPVYKNPDGTWPEVPANCLPTKRVILVDENKNVKKEWIRLITTYPLKTIQEAFIFVFFHETYHFLAHSKQIRGRNAENEADQFALKHLNLWRQDVIRY